MGFQNANEIEFHGLEIWSFDFGKVVESFPEEFVRTLIEPLSGSCRFILIEQVFLTIILFHWVYQGATVQGVCQVGEFREMEEIGCD